MNNIQKFYKEQCSKCNFLINCHHKELRWTGECSYYNGTKIPTIKAPKIKAKVFETTYVKSNITLLNIKPFSFNVKE